MDGPTPLASNGIPFRFRRFAIEGTMTNFLPFFALDAKAKVVPKPRGSRRAELPLNLQVLDFNS